jgi:hypothetical protein
MKQLLDPRVMTSAYQQAPANVPTPLTDVFFTNPEPIDDEQFIGFYDPADRKPAPANKVGAQARIIAVGKGKNRVFNMVYSFNQTTFEMDVYKALRNPDSEELQNRGRREIARVMAKFQNRQTLFKEVWLAKVLTQGVVYLNGAGEILESSSGAVDTADFEMPANNKGNLNGLIADLWSVAGADIPSQLENVVDVSASAHVPKPTDIWLHRKNLKNLRNNNAFKFWAQFNQELSRDVISGRVSEIANLWGFTWHFIDDYYEAQDGTSKPIIPLTGQGSVVITPPPAGNWRSAANGLTLVPRELNVKPDVEALIDSLESVYGRFYYASIQDNPVRIMANIGDHFAFNFNEPASIYAGTAF